jgi:hypothetical protein
VSLTERKTKVAILMMKADFPLPLDLETYLIGEGVDVAALDRLYRK